MEVGSDEIGVGDDDGEKVGVEVAEVVTVGVSVGYAMVMNAPATGFPEKLTGPFGLFPSISWECTVSI